MPRIRHIGGHQSILTAKPGAVKPPLTAWDLGQKSVSVAAQDTSPFGIFIKPDGTTMYIAGAANKFVYQYTLSTAWDASTATYASKSVSVNSQATSPRGVFFSPDGTAMFVVGTNAVYQYTLSTPWDVSTATYASKSVSVNGQSGTAVDIFFKPDGTTMYVMGDANDTVYQYTLSTPWDVSTATYASKNKSVSAQDTVPAGLFFKPDGAVMFVTGTANDAVYQYTLSTPWDVSTATYASKSKSVAAQDTTPFSLFFKTDGAAMYVLGAANDTVYQYPV